MRLFMLILDYFLKLHPLNCITVGRYFRPFVVVTWGTILLKSFISPRRLVLMFLVYQSRLSFLIEKKITFNI